MQGQVQRVFASASLYIGQDDEEAQKYAQLFSFLTERFAYQLETSITPSYSLLCHGVGDSRAFALVYAAMCRRAGLNCETVAGTKDGEIYTWNVIADGNAYYYVDLIRCSQNGRFYPARQWEMGGYVWDYSAFS